MLSVTQFFGGIEVEGVHPILCMMNNTKMVFITVKHNLYTILK
jgi:hypothetical protein